MPLIEDILNKNNITTGNANSIRWKINDIITEYASQNFSNDSMYFVQDNKKTYWLNNKENYNNNVYSVLKVENNQIEEIEINKENIPKEIGVNSVFKIKNNQYIIDEIASNELQNRIKNMADEIIEKQNIELASYRKEGHLYMVREEIGNNRFLSDLTEQSKFEFEEVDIPKDVLDMAVEGTVLKYVNGTYEFYSNDGYEMN